MRVEGERASSRLISRAFARRARTRVCFRLSRRGGCNRRRSSAAYATTADVAETGEESGRVGGKIEIDTARRAEPASRGAKSKLRARLALRSLVRVAGPPIIASCIYISREIAVVAGYCVNTACRCCSCCCCRCRDETSSEVRVSSNDFPLSLARDEPTIFPRERETAGARNVGKERKSNRRSSIITSDTAFKFDRRDATSSSENLGMTAEDDSST